jgi:hypothetical protein
MLEVEILRAVVPLVFPSAPGTIRPVPREVNCCSRKLAPKSGLEMRASALCFAFGSRDGKPLFRGEVGELLTSGFDMLADGAKG